VNLLEKYNNDHDIYRPSVAFKTTTAAIIPHKLTEYYYTKQMSQSQTFVYVYGNRKLTPETAGQKDLFATSYWSARNCICFCAGNWTRPWLAYYRANGAMLRRARL